MAEENGGNARGAVAVIGAGIMGSAMARNLAAAGLTTRVWDRAASATGPLADAGAVVAATPRDAVRDAGVVITMLPTADVVESVMFDGQVVEAFADGCVWAQMGTIGVEATLRIRDRLAALRPGVMFVDAPVSGSKGPAEQGQLLILASGPAAAADAARPVFDVIGRKTVWLGEAGRGSQVKLVVNAYLSILIEGVAETMELADRLGIGHQQLAEVIEGGPLDAPLADAKFHKMDRGDFAAEFPLEWALKDVDLVIDAAGGQALPLLAALSGQWHAAVAAGYGRQDISAARLALASPSPATYTGGPMEYRLLGSSGCAVSALALGTLTFGNETDQATSFSQLDRFAEAGGTLVDSADVYADGRAEEIIGRWLAARPGRRELVVLATKGRFPTDESPNGHGLSRRHLSLALDASLRRLNVETIDLYQLHAWDPLTRLEETLRFLDDAVRAGKINYVGLSNFTGWQLQKAVDIAEFRGLSAPVSMQPQYNLLARAVEWEIAPACQAAGLGMLAWSPLASGWLTGKYRRGEPAPAGTRVVENADEGMRIWNQRGQSEQTWQVLDMVRKVAEGRGVSLAQVAIAWLMARPAVSSVVLGARSMDQLTDNMAAADLKLTPEETQLLDEASEPPAPDYPYGVPGQSQRSRRIRGGRF